MTNLYTPNPIAPTIESTARITKIFFGKPLLSAGGETSGIGSAVARGATTGGTALTPSVGTAKGGKFWASIIIKWYHIG
ncbi:hypothetical protein A2125_02385 [Candidatus Woesebacteria bacterium GWB1_43_5]|uniref:Uncharacterized protein n=1 Tax=Candidatus Woesebacteria bacterium GWB1_43_5 TaxID=1802474 RepID=A0A1F7WT57_9BACT|nr:MAG: hypothetical protein A2125_02385 [Candidatus Woesebacteria bacterium GWB1_43_5]